MRNWWNWVLVVGLVSLLFIAVPLMYPSPSLKTDNIREKFDDYLRKFNKTYKNNTPEYETRLQHFINSVKEIDELNAASRGPESHKARYGLTCFSDMSKDEFSEIHLSSKKREHSHGHNERDIIIYNIYNIDRSEKNIFEHISISANTNDIRKKRVASLPEHFDWRESGVVGPVRDQGLCGACWAFSTVGVMETMAAISSGKLNTLSVQEVIDCAGLGNSGCLGGDICLLLDWLSTTGTPVQLEKEYPLKLKDGVCTSKKNATGVKVKKYTCGDMVGSEEKILETIATHGPVAVAVNALTWQNYLGGIIQYHCGGSPAELNHAVELVGYDITHEVPYYIAKNSWGDAFGVDGYIQLAIGTNICGVANEVASIDVTV